MVLVQAENLSPLLDSLGVFERKILRVIFGPTNDNGEWKIKYSNELYTLYKENDVTYKGWIQSSGNTAVT